MAQSERPVEGAVSYSGAEDASQTLEEHEAQCTTSLGGVLVAEKETVGGETAGETAGRVTVGKTAAQMDPKVASYGFLFCIVPRGM